MFEGDAIFAVGIGVDFNLKKRLHSVKQHICDSSAANPLTGFEIGRTGRCAVERAAQYTFQSTCPQCQIGISKIFKPEADLELANAKLLESIGKSCRLRDLSVESISS